MAETFMRSDDEMITTGTLLTAINEDIPTSTAFAPDEAEKILTVMSDENLIMYSDGSKSSTTIYSCWMDRKLKLSQTLMQW